MKLVIKTLFAASWAWILVAGCSRTPSPASPDLDLPHDIITWAPSKEHINDPLPGIDYATVIMAHNRAGREIPNVVTVYPGKLPISEDGVHTTAEGQFILGKVTATAVEEFYKAKE